MTSAVRVVQFNAMQQGSQRCESSNRQLAFTVSAGVQEDISEPNPVPERRTLVQVLVRSEAAPVQALVKPSEHIRYQVRCVVCHSSYQLYALAITAAGSIEPGTYRPLTAVRARRSHWLS
jgi:hypothetical protein